MKCCRRNKHAKRDVLCDGRGGRDASPGRNLWQFDVADVGPRILVVVSGSAQSIRLPRVHPNLASAWTAQLTLNHVNMIVVRDWLRTQNEDSVCGNNVKCEGIALSQVFNKYNGIDTFLEFDVRVDTITVVKRAVWLDTITAGFWEG